MAARCTGARVRAAELTEMRDMIGDAVSNPAWIPCPLPAARSVCCRGEKIQLTTRVHQKERRGEGMRVAGEETNHRGPHDSDQEYACAARLANNKDPSVSWAERWKWRVGPKLVVEAQTVLPPFLFFLFFRFSTFHVFN
jgi:hypothetical protein